jgi:sec-independent protein translocase protein TatB
MIGGLSMTELIIIMALALLLLGPDQLPSLARSLGKGLRELRKATDDIKGQFESEIARIDLDQQPQKMIAPVPDAPKQDEAAKPSDTPKPASEAPANPADDPGAARAAARRAAAESQLKLVAPEGAVPRPPEELAAPAPEPKA